ncbi:S-adenosyl-L-methionine-dependent methyltransferase [Linderina pennispora]|uniref:S-adenosyl-L-methionine-dependent methyltransferase n=1 Tax=Linderina pennispora TaxID=61395 RepID=A0A1Y1WAQ1_9FUNG|nr:S-adenosyl-L-methionine-dependent methyltransferase [Linderina pennispora]ORX70455.1 S-adenosyl-L-methionine-dependent methyltransferase [Linderina pennispora]
MASSYRNLHTPTREELNDASPEQLRAYYATNASINPNLSVASIPPTVNGVRERTAAKVGRMAGMAIADYQGMLHGFLVGLVNAKRILEIGTFTGTSAIYFATALKRNGVKGGVDETGHKPVVCLDISEEFAEIARSNFREAGLEDYIEVIVGDARENLAKLSNITFDVAFLDADKVSYKYYYDTIIDKGLLNKSGLFIVDNTAFSSVTTYLDVPVPVAADAKPLDVKFDIDFNHRETTVALHEFNEYVRHDPRTEAVMLPLYTGVTLLRFIN